MEKEKSVSTHSSGKSSKPKRLMIKRGGSAKENNRNSTHQQEESTTNHSPPPYQSKLTQLFTQIENEFQKLHEQNSERKRSVLLYLFSDLVDIRGYHI